MSRIRSSRTSSSFFFGLILTVAGGLLLLDRLDIIDIYPILPYWPLIIILFGIVKILRSRRAAGFLTGTIVILIGGIILLNNTHLYHTHFWQWWPLIFILIGGSLLVNNRSRSHNTVVSVDSDSGPADEDSYISAFAVMSGIERHVSSKEFLGGEITAIMGGCKVDLRKASIKSPQAILDLFTFWGGIEILVPRDWHVVMNGHPIMGGMSDTTIPPSEATGKVLMIRGYAIMGGAEIKNEG